MNTIKSMLIFFIISTALIIFSCAPVKKTIDASDAVNNFMGIGSIQKIKDYGQ